jgi:hypothetical protein
MSIACMTRRPYGTTLLLVNGIGVLLSNIT